MPSNKILEAKKQIVENLAAKLQTAQAGVLVKYEGITVADDTALRAALRKAGVEYTVMKNTLTGQACEKVGYGEMKQYLEGMTAIAISQDDPKLDFPGEDFLFDFFMEVENRCLVIRFLKPRSRS